MQIPLLVNANPKNTREGPKVFLIKGDWEIIANCIDTDLTVSNDSQSQDIGRIGNQTILTLGHNDTVQIKVKNPGKENSISVSARLCQ